MANLIQPLCLPFINPTSPTSSHHLANKNKNNISSGRQLNSSGRRNEHNCCYYYIYKYTYHGKHKPWGADKGGLELLLQIKWQIEKVALVGAPIALRGSSVLACCPLPDTGIAYYYLCYVYLSCIVLLHSSNSNNDYTHTQIDRGCGCRLNRVPNDDVDANDCGTMQKYCDHGKAYTCCTCCKNGN